MAETTTARSDPSRPPLVPGSMILGSALPLARDSQAFFVEQYLRFGPIFRVRALHRRFTVLAGPEAMTFVTRNGAHFRSHEFWHGLDQEFGAQRSMISTDGPDHARYRGIEKAGYGRAVIETRLDEVVSATVRAVHTWPVGSVHPVHFRLQHLVTEQLGRMISGVSAADSIDDMIHCIRTVLLTRVTRQRPGLLRWLPRYRRAKARMDVLAQRVLAAQAARKPGDPPAPLIDALVATSREDPAFLPPGDLPLAVLGPFFAGLDTVASTAAFVLHALLTRPTLYEQVVAELDPVFAEGPLSAAALKRLDVLHRTILETMRLYPIAPALSRTVTSPFEFGGHTVEGGETVLIATTVAHHLPQFYAEPERFDIDRYRPGRSEHQKPGAFSPYGAGAHTCLGAGFAEVHLMVLVATLLHTAQLAMDPADYRLRVDPAPTPHPDRGFRMKVMAHRAARRL
jgi:cytochrome P450